MAHCRADDDQLFDQNQSERFAMSIDETLLRVTIAEGPYAHVDRDFLSREITLALLNAASEGIADPALLEQIVLRRLAVNAGAHLAVKRRA